jgi:AraC-like DNA-binding protein
MYTPVQDGIAKSAQSVVYNEAQPPSDLAGLMHCFWELKTLVPLDDDFHLHALPDACVNIMFNEQDIEVAGVTALRTSYEVLNLGRAFHYVGIQFLPGVWRGNRQEIADQYIGTAYVGALPLKEVNATMARLDFIDKQTVMADLVRHLVAQQIVVANGVTATILRHLNDIHNVADMAARVGLSARQLQRVLKQDTGFTPHDLFKVLRLQQAIRQGCPMQYADQSHFIRSFRAITGYTPAQYFSKFNV